MKNDYVCKSRRRAAIELWIKSSILCNITLCITPRDLYTTSTSRLERLLINTNSYIYTHSTQQYYFPFQNDIAASLMVYSMFNFFK